MAPDRAGSSPVASTLMLGAIPSPALRHPWTSYGATSFFPTQPQAAKVSPNMHANLLGNLQSACFEPSSKGQGPLPKSLGSPVTIPNPEPYRRTYSHGLLAITAHPMSDRPRNLGRLNTPEHPTGLIPS
jgi:hypothetical protein